MIRRVYTNQLVGEDLEPELPTEIELVLDGDTLTVERRPEPVACMSPPTDRVPARETRRFASADEARAAFDQGVQALVPRHPIEAPDGEDPTLAWVGPDGLSAELWVRAEEDPPIETGSEPALDDDVLADWMLEQPDPHVRARGALIHGDRTTIAAHTDAWTSGILGIADLGFRRGHVDTLHLLPGDAKLDGAGTVYHSVLAAFLALPICARLRRVVLGPVGRLARSRGEPYVDSDEGVAAIAASCRPIRELVLVGGLASNLAPLRALPNLERLVCRGTALLSNGPLASATLRELELVDANVWADLSRFACPSLRRISIKSRLLDAVVASALPVTDMLLQCDDPMEDLLELLAWWKGFARVEALTLIGADPAVRGDPRLAHVKRLELR